MTSDMLAQSPEPISAAFVPFAFKQKMLEFSFQLGLLHRLEICPVPIDMIRVGDVLLNAIYEIGYYLHTQ
jgi:hypothetical protein